MTFWKYVFLENWYMAAPSCLSNWNKTLGNNNNFFTCNFTYKIHVWIKISTHGLSGEEFYNNEQSLRDILMQWVGLDLSINVNAKLKYDSHVW